MNRDPLASFSKEELIALIEALTKQISMLTKRVEALEAELGKPPKTPDNSSIPPSQGHKANGESETKPKAKAHAGSHRPLHPNPTRRRDVLADRCEHCQADVSAVLQTAVHAYDRIEIPEIVPEVTRVTLHGGLCPCCRQRFRAAPPAGLAPGSPFGPNLRAFVLYLRFAQAIPFARLARLMSDLLGLEISEGALANMLEASGSTFARQARLIRDRLLSGTILKSDETSARVGKKTWWTWVFHNGDSACFVCRPNMQMSVPSNLKMSISPAFWRAVEGGINGGAEHERWGVAASRGLAGRRSWWSAGTCGSAAVGA
jgi:transposase